MTLGGSKFRALEGLRSRVAVEPVLAGLEGSDDHVSEGFRVRGGVTAERIVAASDVATGGTASQMDPPALGCLALDAAGRARYRRRIDGARIAHAFILDPRPPPRPK